MTSSSPAEQESVVILNPAAGRGLDPALFASDVHQRLKCRITTTQGAGDAREAAIDAAARGASQVVAAGGDGTIREVASGLVEGSGSVKAAPVLGILPLGTGNDLARSLGVPLDLAGALDALVEGGSPQAVDLMRVDRDGAREWAVNAVVVGNGGRVGTVLEPDEKSFWGPLSYLRSAIGVALELEPLSLSLQIADDEPSVVEVLNVVVANGRSAAGGIPIAPEASPFDGSLDLAVVENCELVEVMKIGTALVRNASPESAAFQTTTVTRVRVRSRRSPFSVSIDGETGSARDLVIEVCPGRLRVILPRP